ncbi:MAG: tetratricopeptide repeat-containing sensor histidine kinase [Fluviicola sp.]|nr:tetratricopeptide repeat-containing sensor histidine kinase [Fluviicola sp.]
MRLAWSYFQKNNWDSTLAYSVKQLDVTKNLEIRNYAHYLSGNCFREKNLLNDAKSEFTSITDNFKFRLAVKSNLGEIYLEQNNFIQAIKYFEGIEQSPDYLKSAITKSALFHDIGLCHFHLLHYRQAEKYLIEGAELQEGEKDTSGLIASYMDIANLYYEQYQDALAIPYFEKAYQLSKRVNNFELKQNAALNMAVVEENRKHYKEALVYRAEYEAWRDSLTDQNKVWDIAQLEKQFAVKEKQKEVDVLATENKVKVAERNSFIYVAVLLFVLLGTGVYFYRLNVKRSKTIFAQKTELDELNAAKDKLFSIVSHDLRSSVNAMKTSNTNLQSNLATKNYAELDQLLQTNSAIANGAYNLLDNLLHWALLQTEQSYFKQESLRLFPIVEQVAFNYKHLMLEKNIVFEQLIPKSTVAFADPESLKIVLRNLFDNAIKFSKEGGKIAVYVRSEIDLVELVVEDTGLGMSETTRLNLLKTTAQPAKKQHEELVGTGLGLQLCKSMIAKNGGMFTIESEEQVGTKMIVSLPKPEKNG